MVVEVEAGVDEMWAKRGGERRCSSISSKTLGIGCGENVLKDGIRYMNLGSGLVGGRARRTARHWGVARAASAKAKARRPIIAAPDSV